jgi:hypothetical protein
MSVSPATLAPAVFGGARFQVDAPFSTAVLEISPDGQAMYQASSPETGIDEERRTRALSETALVGLMDVVREVDFFALGRSYPYQSGVSYEDGSVYTIHVSLDGETHEVSCYEPECPPAFDRVMEMIREMWGEEILEVGV